jgi:hypothetical protein
VAGREGHGRCLQRPTYRLRLPPHLIIIIRQRHPKSIQEVDVTVDHGEGVEAGPEEPSRAVDPLERQRGAGRSPRIAAKSLFVHTDPFDEAGQHRAFSRVEVEHLGVDPGGSRDPRVVPLGRPVYVV